MVFDLDAEVVERENCGLGWWPYPIEAWCIPIGGSDLRLQPYLVGIMRDDMGLIFLSLLFTLAVI